MTGIEAKKIIKIIMVILVPLIISDLIISHKHVYFPWDNIPGFYAIFGFISCIAIIFIAKKLALIGLKKKENYYDL